MCLNSFLKSGNANNLVGAAYINDRSKNELAHFLLMGEHIINKEHRMHAYEQS